MTNETCNVPGCDDPLGDDTGVWCEEHYRSLHTGADR